MPLKGNKNRRNGFAYEYRFVKKLIKKGYTKVKRHYGSIGVTDIDWVDKEGKKNTAQLKFSTIRHPKLAQADYTPLQKYVITHPDTKVWLVTKLSRRPEMWELIGG